MIMIGMTDASNNDGLNNEAQQTLGDAMLTAKAMTSNLRVFVSYKKLRKLVSWAIRDYNMIEDGDGHGVYFRR